MKDGQPVMSFGLMGGSQQAQGHAQVLVDMIDLGANPQAASDAARFTHAQETNTLDLESNLYDLVGGPLRAKGHKVTSANGDAHGRLSGHLGTTRRGLSRRVRSSQGWAGGRVVTHLVGGTPIQESKQDRRLTSDCATEVSQSSPCSLKQDGARAMNNIGSTITRAPIAKSVWRSAACASLVPQAPTVAPTTATGLLYKELGSPRESQSMAFFMTAGSE